MARKLEGMMADKKIPEGYHAHPRLVQKIINESSWVEDEFVQDMWVGLLASACTESGNDDSNLVFTNLLSSLTRIQARILNHACVNATKRTPDGQLIMAD